MLILNPRFYCLLIILIMYQPFNSYADAVIINDNVHYVYRLGPGDNLRIKVFGEDSLSGEFEISPSGFIAMGMIGQVRAVGLNSKSLAKLLEEKYADGYLVAPQISIEVTEYRPFFILGEVKKPGSFPYVNGLTVLNAVALAGGYTKRASIGTVLISRDDAHGKKISIRANEHNLVRPGDIIRISERFF